MNQWKKYCITLVVLLALGLLPQTALASFIDTDQTGSITIHSLAVDGTEASQPPATGEEVEEVEGEPLANISYTVTRVSDDSTDAQNPGQYTGQAPYDKTIPTDQYGRALFEDLPLGVYLVHQEDSAAVEQAIADFLVDLPMTNPAGTSRIYNVNVYPKYQLLSPPQVDAFVTDTDTKSDSLDLYGQSEWIISARLPGDIAAAQQFQVDGDLHRYLAYETGSVQVYAEARDAARVTLDADTDYTAVSQDRLLSVALTENGLKKLKALSGAEEAALSVRFQTTLDIPAGELAQALSEKIELGAQLHYTNSLGRPATTTPEAAPYVYTGGVNILKIRTADSEPLEGASFKLYRTGADAQAQQNAIKDPEGEGDWIATTNGEGLASFAGLAYGGPNISNTAGTAQYFLVQTQAPAGYNLLRAPVEITVDATSHLEDNAVTIQGRSGFLLPATGGMGTFWFTVIGLLIIAAALLLFWRMRRSRSRDERSR